MLFDDQSGRISNVTGFFLISLLTVFLFFFFNFVLTFVDSMVDKMFHMSDLEDAYRILNDESHKYSVSDLKKVQIGQYFDNGIRPDNDKY